MKIGIFISGRFPEEGGGYTITYDIFNQLIKTIKNKKNFIFILLNDNNNYLKNKLKTFDLYYKDFKEIGRVFPEKGKTVIFPGQRYHCSTLPTKKTRTILNFSWC